MIYTQMYIMCSHVRNLAGVGGQHAALLEDISGNICTYIYISPTSCDVEVKKRIYLQ